MLMQPLLDQLIQLHLPAFRDGLQEQLHNPQYAELSFEERLALLVEREVTLPPGPSSPTSNQTGGLSSIGYCGRSRSLPRTRTGAPLRAGTGSVPLDRPASQYPHSWTDRIRKVLPQLCPWSCGLSYRSFRALFRTSRLLFQLAQAHVEGSYSSLLASLAKIDLLILDDWLRDPISIAETRDLLEILDDRFGRSSTLVASQLPVSEWFTQFPSPTHADSILDRLIHNAYRLNLTGDSQRKLRANLPMPST